MEEARATALAGHDEFWKFLGPYGWSRGYMGPDGKPVGARPDPDARRVDREQDDAGRHAGARRRRRSSSSATCSASSTSRSSRTCSATPTRRPTSRWPASPRRSLPLAVLSERSVDDGRRSAAGRGADQGPRVGGAGEHPVGLDHDRVGVTEAGVPRRRDRTCGGRGRRRSGAHDVGGVAFDVDTPIRSRRRSRCRTRSPDRGGPSGRR